MFFMFSNTYIFRINDAREVAAAARQVQTGTPVDKGSWACFLPSMVDVVVSQVVGKWAFKEVELTSPSELFLFFTEWKKAYLYIIMHILENINIVLQTFFFRFR